MSVRYGIIGSGRMGTNHAKQLQKIEGAKLAAVCDAHLQTAQALGDKTGANVYTDFNEMLDKEQLDAVYLCTPVRGRLQQIEAITAHRVNLYVEKPLAASVEEGEQITRLVEDSGIICTVGFQWRYFNLVKIAKEIAYSDPISLMVGRWYWMVPAVGWIQNRTLGGGQVFDQTIHLIDLATYFGGPIDHVYSAFTQKSTIGEMENWDGYSTTALFQNQSVGNFYSTYALYPGLGEEPFLEIIQKNRLIRITPGKLTVKTPGDEKTFAREDTGIHNAFHNAVEQKDSTQILAPIRDALHTLRVVLSANYSAQHGVITKISELSNFGLDDLKAK